MNADETDDRLKEFAAFLKDLNLKLGTASPAFVEETEDGTQTEGDEDSVALRKSRLGGAGRDLSRISCMMDRQKSGYVKAHDPLLEHLGGSLSRCPTSGDVILLDYASSDARDNPHIASKGKPIFSLRGTKVKCLVSIVGAIALVAIPVVLSSLTNHSSSAEPIESISISLRNSSAVEAEALVRAFYQIDDPIEQAGKTVEGAEVTPFLMEKRSLLDTNGPIHVVRRKLVDFSGYPYFVAQVRDRFGKQAMTFVSMDGKLPKLDWKASVGFCELPFDEFVSDRPLRPQIMRLLIYPSDYYNHGYGDQSRYVSFEVRHELSGIPLHVYADKQTEAASILRGLFKDSSRHPKSHQDISTSTEPDRFSDGARRITLSLVFEPMGLNTGQAFIEEVLAEDWVYFKTEI